MPIYIYKYKTTMQIGHLPVKVYLNNSMLIAYGFVFKVKILYLGNIFCNIRNFVSM